MPVFFQKRFCCEIFCPLKMTFNFQCRIVSLRLQHIFMPQSASWATVLQHASYAYTRRSLTSLHVPTTCPLVCAIYYSNCCHSVVQVMAKWSARCRLHDHKHKLACKLKQMQVTANSLITKYFVLLFILAYQIHIKNLFYNLQWIYELDKKFIYNSLPNENSLYSMKQLKACFTEKTKYTLKIYFVICNELPQAWKKSFTTA